MKFVWRLQSDLLKRRDSSDHRTGCSTWRVAQHKMVRRTLEIWCSLCRAVYKLQFNVGYAHIELQKRKCPTDLCSCVGMWGGGVSGWCATKHSQYAFSLWISLLLPASLSRLVALACPEANIGFSLRTTLLEGQSCTARDKHCLAKTIMGIQECSSCITDNGWLVGLLTMHLAENSTALSPNSRYNSL